MTPQPLETRVSPRGRCYGFHPHHRNNHPCKSQWTVQRNTEFAVFRHAEHENWGDGQSDYWGLHLVDGEIRYLGRCVTDVRLNIARFVNDAPGGTWHGYPANPRLRRGDRPSDDVLDLWEASQLIAKHQRKKLVRRQLCSL